MAPKIVLCLEKVSKTYGARRVLRDLSLTVEPGEAVAVVGPNGTGKSTLLRIVAGVLRQSDGTVTFRTEQGEKSAAEERRPLVGYASPDLAFYPELTGLENLLFFASVRRRDAGSQQAETVKASCQEALEKAGLGRRGGDPVAVYSSGMRQRLRLAFARLANAPLLLLDEPSLALDTQGVGLVAEMVAEQRSGGGITLLATNDLEEAKLGGRAVVLG